MIKFDRRTLMAAGAATLIDVASRGATPASAQTAAAADLQTIAVEAYHYFYSLLSMEITRRVTTNVPPGGHSGFGPMNQFHHLRAFPTADFRAVVRPNFDTLYSSAWLDLTAGPVIVSAPDTADRYYLLPMLDMWTDVFASPGKRTSGTSAANFAVTPAGWSGQLPEGAQRIVSPTPHVWVIGRTQTNGPADYPAVARVQDGYRITPLAQWGGTPVAPSFTADPTVDMQRSPKAQVDGMNAADYYRLAAELMKLNPPHVSDWSMLARLRRLGIVPGQSFDFAQAPAPVRAALERSTSEGLRTMAEKLPTLARIVNGWQMNTDTMGVYGNYYLKRAIVAQAGLGANQPEDAIYPLNVADADGRPVTGGARYTLQFARAELPPVNAFWSLTMYDAEGFQVANAINRFAIGDRDALKPGADGSVTLYIQHDDPGGDRTANWLPTPASGELGLTMRLYAPRAEALDGRWAPPAIRRAA